MRAVQITSLLAAVLLAACGGDDEARDAAATDTLAPPSMGPAPGDTAMGGMAHEGMSGGGAHLTLQPVGGSTATGMAMLSPGADGTRVELSVSGATAGATLPAHIHRGRCGNDQGVAAPLESVSVGADGTGSSTSTAAAADLTGETFVQVHGDGGTPILCADMPAGA